MDRHGGLALSRRRVPYCDSHGRMQYKVRFMWWECSGFDGEGCPVQFVTDELIQDCVLDRLPRAGVTLCYEGEDHGRR
ncbi:MAG TPA: hypothetical protein VFN75_09680 [Pseudonocardiaceae bacterium]|nr:hypothetical protein [Pseudonocardiaceae bacterium]